MTCYVASSRLCGSCNKSYFYGYVTCVERSRLVCALDDMILYENGMNVCSIGGNVKMIGRGYDQVGAHAPTSCPVGHDWISML